MPDLFGYRPTTNIKIALTRVPEIKKQTRRVAAVVRNLARPQLLRDTGAGARSVKVVQRTVGGAQEYRVSWDKAHFYMSFHQHNLDVLRRTAQLVQHSNRIAPPD
jgi:hypothetical protein